MRQIFSVVQAALLTFLFHHRVCFAVQHRLLIGADGITHR
jgi:hypothetical protein